MPHVTIKHFPKSLNESEKQQLAEKIASVITESFGCRNDVVSIATEAVTPDRWAKEVYEPLIVGGAEGLIKKPRY